MIFNFGGLGKSRQPAYTLKNIVTGVMIFFGYIIMDEGDQFTAEHYMVTALSTVPFVFALLVKFLMSGAEK